MTKTNYLIILALVYTLCIMATVAVIGSSSYKSKVNAEQDALAKLQASEYDDCLSRGGQPQYTFDGQIDHCSLHK